MAVTTNKKAAGRGSNRGEHAGRNSRKKADNPRSAATAAPRGRKNAAAPAPENEPEDFIGAEVMILSSFAVAVLLFLSNFHLCGAAGRYLRSFQLGVFGMVGFIAPLLLFTGTCFYLSNRENLTAMRKLLASIALVLVLCGLVQLLLGKSPEEGTGLMEYYHLSSEKGAGGGLIGGLICTGLRAVLGNIGTFLVLIVCLAVSVVCITERSLVNAVKRQGDAAYRYAREDMDRRKERHAERQEERRRLRQERVRGVDLAATDFSAQENEGNEHFYEEPVPDGGFAEQAGRQQQEADWNGREAERIRQEKVPAGWNRSGQPVGYEAAGQEESSLTKEAGKGKNIRAADAKTGESRESQQGFLSAGERAEGKASTQPDPEPTVDPADVFSGEIMMAGNYEGEDFAPFEADKVLSPAESAQLLVAEGISRLSDYEGSFGRPVEPPAFHKPASEPAYHGLAAVLDEPVKGTKEPGEKGGPEKTEELEAESEAADAQGTQTEDESSYSLEPLRLMSPGFSYQEEEEDEIFMGRPGEPSLSEYSPEMWKLTEEFPDGEEEVSKQKDYPEEDVLTEAKRPAVVRYQADPPGEEQEVENSWDEERCESDYEEEEARENDNSGEFVIPEESRRVVTATGKVIESDTEALHKRLESKRQEAKEAREEGEISVQQQIREKEAQPKREYRFPSVSLLKRGNLLASANSQQEYKDTAIKLQQTLRNFGVGVTVTNISCGPSVTRYELHPEQGVKVSKIVGLADDIKLSLAAADIRIEAPIPGKSAVGIEVPNKENTTVYLRELLESEAFRNHPSQLAFAVGKDIGGQVVVTDIAKMPHLLIAGATGSGKSVCINTLIMSILFKSRPEDVKLIMVDPKVVELSVYNGIPHLLIPVVTDPKKASGALNWAVAEMQDRYKKFAECNVRNLKGYNSRIENLGDVPEEEKPKKLPQIVIIVDELADLMMVAPGEVEDAICRLAQLARAAGIHLVIATQRPSVNVITGLIKANVPSRIAFSVSSGVDSRTIIDMHGAEKLLGKGDMLFFPSGIPKPQRVQGAFVSDSEVQKVVEFLADQGLTAEYNPDVEKQMNAAPVAGCAGSSGGNQNGRDEYFEQAGRFIIEKEKASIGMLQRMFKIGFNRAARIMDQLADAGVVGEEEGTKPRKILVTMEEFEEILSWEE